MPITCKLLVGKLYPTMTMTNEQPSPQVCVQGKGRGLETCLKCEKGDPQ